MVTDVRNVLLTQQTYEEDNMIQGQCFHTDDESNVDICEKDYVNNGALAAKQHLQMEREDFS